MNKEEEISTTHFVKVFKIFWPYIRPYFQSITVALGLVLLCTFSDLIRPIVTGKIVDLIVIKESHIIVLRWSLYYLFLIFVQFVLDSLRAYVTQNMGQSWIAKMRSELFYRLLRFPVFIYDKNPIGRFITRISSDVKAMGEVFTASVSVILTDIILIVGSCFAMFFFHWKFALVILLPFPIVIFSIHIFGKKLSLAYRNSRKRLSALNAFLGENIPALSTIHRLSAQKQRLKKFEDLSIDHFNYQLQSAKVFSLSQPIANTVNGYALFVLFSYGGYLVWKNEITLGVVVTFLGYIRNLFIPIRDLVEKYNTLLSAKVASERISDILDTDVEFEDTPFSDPKALGVLKRIEFRNVSFTYPQKQTHAISNISFHLNQGEKLAIVGATGSGKSTLVRLLLRFYEPTEGHILFNSQPIKSMDIRLVRSQIGVIHQDSYFFRGSLRENLHLGAKEISENKIEEVYFTCKMDTIFGKRKGLDLSITEGGSNLSSGEKQIISVARILLLNHPIIVFDEATSHLDHKLEKHILDAIEPIFKDRIGIRIAHRLSTLKDCNYVLSLENGRMVNSLSL